MSDPILEIADLSKDYRGLRPLRIERLVVAAGEQVAIVGVDQPAAETFVNLVTGATLPDRGHVRLFGRPTSAISDSAEWLSVVDRFGIVTERAVLLDGLSVIQNVAVPFTLKIEPPPPDVEARAIELAREAGLAEAVLSQAVGALDASSRMRVRLARALALDPAMLLLEHPTAGVPRGHVAALARDIRDAVARRGMAMVAVTEDVEFAEAAAPKVLALHAPTGRLDERRRGLLSRLLG